MKAADLKSIIVFSVFLLWSPSVSADPAVTYKAKCQMCHGADGKGNQAMNVSPLDLSKTDADLTKAIREGIKPKMPAYSGKLTPEEIVAMATYLRSLK